MSNYSKEKSDFNSILIKPETANILAILSGLSFLLLGMLLPLVGKAGAQTEHYTKNYITFLFILILAATFSGLNLKSRIERRKLDGSPFPRLSLGLCILCGVLFISLFAGLLKI